MTSPHGTEVTAHVIRLLWRDQLRALPRSLGAALRRLLRREARWYLVVDDRIIGRLTDAHGSAELLRWVRCSHESTFRTGRIIGAQDGGPDA